MSATTVAILLAAAVCLTLPIYLLGMPAGNDLPQHYRFAITIYDAIQGGSIYPAWSGETNLGFGDVGLRLYPPLAYYVIAVARFFTSSWNDALAISIGFWFLVSGIGSYLFAREYFSARASLLAAIVFMAMPYHANQVYNAGLLAEFAAIAILPFCFWSAKRVITHGRIVDVASLAISFALLVLTNIPMAVIGSICLVTFALLSIRSGATITGSLARLGLAVGGSLIATSFYWVRLVTEMSFVKHSTPEFTSSVYDFRRNFLAGWFYVPADVYPETSLWFTDLLLVITLAMIVPGLIIVWKLTKSEDRAKMKPLVGLLGFVVFISTPLSAWLWNISDLLQKIQFPWRFLGVISLVGALFAGACTERLPDLFRDRMRPAALLVSGLLLAGLAFTAAQVIRPAAYSDGVAFDQSFDTFRTDRSNDCWWPIWASEKAFDNRERVAAASRETDVDRWHDSLRTFSIASGPAEKVRIATFYYPHWQATANGTPIPIEPASDGTIVIDAPSEASEIQLAFFRPHHEVLAICASVAGWVILFLLLFVGIIRSRSRLIKL